SYYCYYYYYCCSSAPRKRRGVIIQDPKEAASASVSVQSEDEAFAREFKANLSDNINWNEVVDQYSAATCIFGGVIATLTKQVANLELDKVAQAIEITKLKQRSGGGCIQTRRKIAELDADEDVTLEEV
nr:hypothetical protein [Tanacetum cinerariifolium]